MSLNTQFFVVNNVKLSVNASVEEAFFIAKRKLASIGISDNNLEFSIYKKSVDARNKNDIKLVYSISCRGNVHNMSARKGKDSDISLVNEQILPEITHGEEKLSSPPLIVGAGPAGLFAALLLAEKGYKPIIIERGGSVTERKITTARFNELGILDTNTNIQFGAGGAGTFSDGKLVTRINDPMSSYVLKKLVEFGAPDEILYLARPHVGTDVLSTVIDKIIDEIERLGGKILYHTKYINSVERRGESFAVTNNGEIPYGALILAIGHSARDTYKTLIENNFHVEGKPFSVGMRIEHLASDIDSAMYGKFAGHKNLGHAEYNLSHNTKVRGVYTFCMCPGGEVVAAASEEGGVVVNGMSNHARSGANSNSAVVCSIFKEDYGSSPEKAIEFQRKIERAAFLAAGSDYSAPIVTVGDFLSDKAISEPTDVIPTYRGGVKTKIITPETYLPGFVCGAIKNALSDFDRKIKGFAAPTAILTGAETRTSAPVRITRDADTRIAIGTKNIYPCGEGAGYAGGITSAAIDGIKTAYAVIEKYKPI